MPILAQLKKRGKKTEQILKLARNSGVVSTAEVRAAGIHHEYLRQMCANGEIARVGHGLYSLPDADITIHQGLVQVAKAVPRGVVCLLSALRFHEIGTQAPHETWIALDRRAATPRVKLSRMRIVRFSGEALDEGIDEYMLEGVRVRIYNPAKTVADCFKYRNKIGLDVALEALREVLRDRKYSVDDLWKYANICRVTKIIRPYIEAIVCQRPTRRPLACLE